MCCDYRPPDSVVRPVPQPSQHLGFIQQTPPRSPLYRASSSLPVRSQQKGSSHSSPRASEFRILETPFVVKVSVRYLAFAGKLGSFHLPSRREKEAVYNWYLWVIDSFKSFGGSYLSKLLYFYISNRLLLNLPCALN